MGGGPAGTEVWAALACWAWASQGTPAGCMALGSHLTLQATSSSGRTVACAVGLVAGGSQVTSWCVARGPGGGRSP